MHSNQHAPRSLQVLEKVHLSMTEDGNQFNGHGTKTTKTVIVEPKVEFQSAWLWPLLKKGEQLSFD